MVKGDAGRMVENNVSVSVSVTAVGVQEAVAVCSSSVCITWGLKVQRNHLAASIPKDLRHIITGVHSASFGVDPTHLPLVVAAHLIQGKHYRFFRDSRGACGLFIDHNTVESDLSYGAHSVGAVVLHTINTLNFKFIFLFCSSDAPLFALV